MSIDWRDPHLQAALQDADLSITCRRWMPGEVYELNNGEFFERDRIPARCPRCSFQWCVMCWECDCDLTEGHRWDCVLTPIWEQTIRDGYLPTMGFG